MGNLKNSKQMCSYAEEKTGRVKLSSGWIKDPNI